MLTDICIGAKGQHSVHMNADWYMHWDRTSTFTSYIKATQSAWYLDWDVAGCCRCQAIQCGFVHNVTFRKIAEMFTKQGNDYHVEAIIQSHPKQMVALWPYMRWLLHVDDWIGWVVALTAIAEIIGLKHYWIERCVRQYIQQYGIRSITQNF